MSMKTTDIKTPLLDYSGKTDRELRSLYDYNSPLVPNFHRYPLGLQTEMLTKHRSAWAERQTRQAARQA